MKTIHFNVQAKGGAGKSMLTYFQALKYETDNAVAFVDLDGATSTSSRQLKFLNENTTRLPRIFSVSVVDSRKRIDRERFLEVIERCCETAFETIYIDMGASESEQLIQLFSMDFPAAEFEQIEKELNVKLIFNVVVAGGASYVASFEYLKRLTDLLNGKFDLFAYVNEFTFLNYNNLIQEVNHFCEKTNGLIKEVRTFGNIQPDRFSGQLIMECVKEGKGIESIKKRLSAKIKIKQELEKI